MINNKLHNSLFYYIKPTIPRNIQIWLRCILANRKRRLFSHTWPIDPNSTTPPDKWVRWPYDKNFALVITHDVDTKRGLMRVDKIADLEETFGLRSSFNFVPLRYSTPSSLIKELSNKGFEVGVHGLYHDGKLYQSKEVFQARAVIINDYLENWDAVGFRSPSMHSNLDWLHDLNISYDSSTFDTDPFEPYPHGAGTIFPFLVRSKNKNHQYIELPYTLPQDFTLFVLLKEKTISIWKKKLDWIAEHNGMALVNVHPDYISFNNLFYSEHYPIALYKEFLSYATSRYKGMFWNPTPKEISSYTSEFL